MRAFKLIRAEGLQRGCALAAVGAVLACGACSLLLDHNATQCQSDTDCKLGFLPYCMVGACVSSGRGPAPDCFFGTPVTQKDFHNQCSASFLPPGPPGGACLSYDDCTSLGVCGDAAPPPLPASMVLDAGTASDAGRSDAAGAPNVVMLPSCAGQATAGGVVYITGSSNFPTVLQKMAPVILKGTGNGDSGPMPIFLTSSSCTGAKSLFSLNPADQMMTDPLPGSADAKYAHYFDVNGNMLACTLGQGAPVDIGESDVYSTTCDPTYLSGNGVFETLGPNQAMAFVVPVQSTQQTISHEAAREVFGLGGNAGTAAPWTNSQYYFVRNKNTGTQQMIGLEIGVNAGAFWGVDQGSADNVRFALEAANNNPAVVQHAIGIISVDVYDGDRPNLRVLAYKESDQECAYLPDSTVVSKDKRNVRDGHYTMWGPLHFFTVSGSPGTAPGVLLSYLDGANQTQPVIDNISAASLVPICAMTVQQAQGVELGDLASFAPTLSCACYFEHTTSPGEPPAMGCTSCDSDDDCPSTRKCSLGFCELVKLPP
jgi:hypothetical protein